MFPSLLIQPEITFTSYWVVYLVLTFGFFLRQFKKILVVLSALLILFVPFSAKSMMGAPGRCGSSCMASWGNTSYPSVYYGNYSFNPYSFYVDPYAYYRMLSPWYGASLYQTPYGRAVQSIVEPKVEAEKK